ncbi:MAG: DNA-3-methyladenine glycosylase [Actinomycetota bacterium]|nr:DNA-3-methyladenine glycosylase [Actinomycetota bacterium]
MRRLRRSFYERDALVVARELIGCLFVHRTSEGRLVVRLVETEAYRGEQDPGSHGYRGMTPRTQVMFGPPGRLYVYFTYGMHWCANVVCGTKGTCEAVLLRAGEPVTGMEEMRRRRGGIPPRLVAAGPARLTQAMGITKEHNGASLVDEGALFCAEDAITARYRSSEIAETVRVGLARGRGEDLPWRFAVADNPFTSRRR